MFFSGSPFSGMVVVSTVAVGAKKSLARRCPAEMRIPPARWTGEAAAGTPWPMNSPQALEPFQSYVLSFSGLCQRFDASVAGYQGYVQDVKVNFNLYLKILNIYT